MRIALYLLVGLLLATCAGVGQESWLISEEDEIAMGQQFHAELLKEMPAWTGDARVSQYVTALGQAVVPHTDRPALAYTFTVVETDEINAFAVPGGFVYVTAGLLRAAGSGAEVATVIAHELGHISARHGVQALERQVIEQGLVDLLGTSNLGPIVQTALQLGTGLVFDQDQEYEADQLGVQYATAAGFNAWGMVDFFQYLQTLEGTSEPADPLNGVFSQLGELFSTHPPTTDRISRVETQLQSLAVQRTSTDYAWEDDTAFSTIAPLL